MSTTEIAIERYGLWIAGEQREARSGATFTRTSPYTGATVSEYANADEADAQEAIAAARRAFDDGAWANAAARERHDILQRTGELLRENASVIAERVALEAG